MPLRKHQIKEWGPTDHIVEEWLKERQELLVLYYHLSKTTPFAEEQCENDTEALANFCQILTDYVSAGHFEVFERIAEASEAQDNNNIALDRELIVQILKTTNIVMDFCTKHANGKNLDNLNPDLSVLGEQLALRMDLEDSLIKIYLTATARIEAPKHQSTIANATRRKPNRS